MPAGFSGNPDGPHGRGTEKQIVIYSSRIPIPGYENRRLPDSLVPRTPPFLPQNTKCEGGSIGSV